jgi:hypothetical protein
MIHLTFRSIFFSHLAWIDLAFFFIFGALHALSWPYKQLDDNVHADLEARNRAASTLSTATTSGLTAVGILLPLSLVAIQVIDVSRPPRQAGTVGLNLFVADMWLSISLLMGLVVMWHIGAKGTTRNILYSRWAGIPFGLQLFSLVLGVVRILVSVFVLVNAG